ncbi:unnamed protein product [Ambrosiozyma monospora]|uniref:Unnamed protein product n=1 Tax=Ambrosiozyma monospora TaxID=43982 RepID=A0ACB5TEG6_AMBMO|nr:unnamed protein product [Ambrosiozyma monospora]
MYLIYGQEFLDEAYLYHLVRLDHRHNFSVYNVGLYFTSFTGYSSLNFLQEHNLKIEQLAFVPQLLLSIVLIPLGVIDQNSATLYQDLLNSFFIQTFTFITYNKVCTSQYFIWFLCLLPNYLASTSISGLKGLVMVLGWVVTQGLWLFYGYKLEFLGESGIFAYGIWSSSLVFFIWNVVVISSLIQDQKQRRKQFHQTHHKTE